MTDYEKFLMAKAVNRRGFLKGSSIALGGALLPITAGGNLAEVGRSMPVLEQGGRPNAMKAFSEQEPEDDRVARDKEEMKGLGWVQQIWNMRASATQNNLARGATVSVRKEGIPGSIALPELTDGSVYNGWQPIAPSGVYDIEIKWDKPQRFNTLVLHANWMYPFISAPSYLQIAVDQAILVDLRNVTWPLNCHMIRLTQLDTHTITVRVLGFYRFGTTNFPALHHPLTEVEVLQLDREQQDEIARQLTSASENMLAAIGAEAEFWCAFASNQTPSGVNALLRTGEAKNIPEAFRQSLTATSSGTDFSRFRKPDNLNTIISRMVLFLRDNKYAVISPESKPRDFNTNRDWPISIFLSREGLYWGSLHNTIPAINIGGGVTYPMYGNSFSLAALNILRQESGAHVFSERLDRVHTFLFSGTEPSPRLNEPGEMVGSFWGQEGVLNDKLIFTDQGFRRWIWAHASFVIAYFIAEASLLQRDTAYPYRDSYLRTAAWMLSKQRPDGSWPWYWEYVNDRTYRESPAWCGDAWWAVLALWRGIEAGMFNPSGGPDQWGTEALARDRAVRTVTFMIEHGCKALEYRGMFEDVGGPCDSFTPSLACLALCKSYDHTRDKTHLEWATRAMELGASMIRHEPSPFRQVESIGVYAYDTSTVFLMLLAAAELNKRTPDYKWNKLSTVGSYLATAQRRDPTDPMYGGLAWNGTLFNPEWQDCQMVWVSHRVLAARASAHPKIQVGEDLRGTAFGQKVSFVALDCPGLECSPEVDYALLKAETDDFLVLLPDPDVPGTARINLRSRAVYYADSGAHIAKGSELKVDKIVILRLSRAT